MKVNDILKGEVFKNHIELCNRLEISSTGGNTKIKNLKEFSRFFDYKQEGKSFTILEKYDFPKLPLENVGRTAKHTQYGEILLMQLLLQQKEKTLTISNIELAKRLSMIHSNFSEYYGSRVKLSNMLDVDLNVIHDFMDATNSAYKGTIKTIIKRLKNKMAIVYENRLKVMIKEYDYETGDFEIVYRFASEFEKEEIARIQYEVLQENYNGNMAKVRALGKVNEYYSKVNEITKSQYRIQRSYNVHVISFNHNAIEDVYLKQMKLLDILSPEELRELKLKINNSFLKRNIDGAKRRQNSAIESINKNGYNNVSKIEQTRSDSHFLTHTEKLNDALVKDGVMEMYIRK